MARWRLTNKHYLNVPGTEWMHEEVNRDTGRKARKIFPVPEYLDPDDPGCYNYPGEIIVCHEGKGEPRDKIFVGPPTPDMEPLDNEAKAISQEMSKRWQHPIDSLPANGGDYGGQLLEALSRQLDAMIRQNPLPKATVEGPVSISGVSAAEFGQLQDQVSKLMEQNAQLLAKLSGKEAEVDEEPDLASRDALADAEFAATQRPTEQVRRA